MTLDTPANGRSLPAEIYDAIATEIASPRDLLSLALACKAIGEIVIKRHMSYREVRLETDDWRDIWTDLDLHPDRSCNVRRLVVTAPLRSAEPTSTSPRIKVRVGKNQESSMDPPFEKVVSRMPRLESLTIGDRLHGVRLKPFWKSLTALGSLRYLDFTVLDEAFLDISGLESLCSLSSMRFKCNVRMSTSACTKLFDWIINNPALEKLSVRIRYYGDLHLAPFLERASFPHLQSLELSLSINVDSRDSLTSFIKKHDTIEDLIWAVNCYETLSWKDESLPLLKNFSGHMQLLTCPSKMPRKLESIDELALSRVFWLGVLPKIDASKLRKLVIRAFSSGEDVLRLPREFPGLVSLRVNGSAMYLDEFAGEWKLITRAQWLDIIGRFSHLRVFSGFCLFSSPSAASQESEANSNDGAVLRLAKLLPALEFIDHWDFGSVVHIIRDTMSEVISWEVRPSQFADSIK